MAFNYCRMGPTMVFRSEIGYTELEKRQLFLRSYQFSRKQSVGERIKKSFFRVKKALWVRFRSARKLRKMLWLKLGNGLLVAARRRRRFFLRLHNCNYSNFHDPSRGSSRQSYCFC